MRVAVLMVPILLQSIPAESLNPAYAIDSYAHATWTRRGGAFIGTPSAIAQTKDGYLWLGTEFGLTRFDGVRFVPWRSPSGSPFDTQPVVALRGTPDGSLWIGTARGLGRWLNGTLTQYQELAGRYVTSIQEDADGAVWVGTSAGVSGNAMLCAVDAASVRCDDAAGALGRFVISIHADRRKNLWVGTATGLWHWRPGTPRMHAMPTPLTEIHSIVENTDGALLLALNREIRLFADGRLEHYPLPDDAAGLKPTSLLHDRDGALWIGTQDQGLIHVSQGRVDRFSKNDGLSGDFVSDIFEDREGNVWVATLDGLDRFHDLAVPTISPKQGLSTASVVSVLADPDGTIWLGTVNGLNRWKDGQISAYGAQPGAPREGVASLLRDHRGRLWVSSPRGLSYLEEERLVRLPGIPGGYVHAMIEDRTRSLWVGDQEHGLYELRDGQVVRHLTRAALGGQSIRTLAADPNRNGLWVGFFSGGIAYVENGSIQAAYGPRQGLDLGEVTAIYPDKAGMVWIAAQRGLGQLASGKLTILTEKEGLPCSAVHWVIEDDRQSLWLYTACGLVRITRPHLDAWTREPARPLVRTVFTERDGVSSRSQAGSYGPKVARAPDGRLLFATYGGLSVIDPAQIPSNALPPPVHVERLIADGTSYVPSSRLQLQPLVRNLRIDFTALSLVVPEKVRFRYKLEGRDEDWVEATNRREVFYTDLPPRDYRFRVIAANNDEVWNDAGAELAFSILPAFYETRAFMVTVTALGIAGLWAVYRLRLRRIATRLNMRFEERLTERARIAQELHDTLLQGFISTAMQLDMITETVGNDDPTKSKLDRVLQRMREVINEGRDAVQGLRARPAVDDLAHTLARGAEDLRGNQAVEIRLVVVGLPRPLNPLIRDEIYRIGREALANAFRHANPTRVEIELEYATNQFRLKVRDNGQGFESGVAEFGRPGHWGVSGMRERAERIGARLQIRSRIKAGTEVDLVVPGQVAFRIQQTSWPWRWPRRTQPQHDRSRAASAPIAPIAPGD